MAKINERKITIEINKVLVTEAWNAALAELTKVQQLGSKYTPKTFDEWWAENAEPLMSNWNLDGVSNNEVVVCSHEYLPMESIVEKCFKCGQLKIKYH